MSKWLLMLMLLSGWCMAEENHKVNQLVWSFPAERSPTRTLQVEIIELRAAQKSVIASVQQSPSLLSHLPEPMALTAAIIDAENKALHGEHIYLVLPHAELKPLGPGDKIKLLMIEENVVIGVEALE